MSICVIGEKSQLALNMNPPMHPLLPLSLRAACFGVALLIFAVRAEDSTSTTLSAQDMAARLSAIRQDGASYVRLRLEVQQPLGTTKIVLQLQIKERRTKTAHRCRLPGAVAQRTQRRIGSFCGKQRISPRPASLFVPPDTVASASTASQDEASRYLAAICLMKMSSRTSSRGSTRRIVGTEVVDRVSCQILESKPARVSSSSYASVRSWVDTRRLVPASRGEIPRLRPARAPH